VIFRHPKVVDFLLKNGRVATMRTWKYKPGQIVVIKTDSGTFRGRIVDVVPNTPENRLKFYKMSGFDNVDEWLMEAIKLHKRIPRYIVVVQINSHRPYL